MRFQLSFMPKKIKMQKNPKILAECAEDKRQQDCLHMESPFPRV